MFSVDDEGLKVIVPNGLLTPDLRKQLRQHKSEILAFLARQSEGEALERRFGHKAARLYPFLGKTVQTPEGGGRLCQVFAVQVGVVLEDSPERVTFFMPDEVRPCPGSEGSLTERPVG